MSALVLDAGALIAVDRDHRPTMARLKVAQRGGLDLRSTGAVIAQVWRDPAGHQANLSRLMKAVDVRAVDERLGRAAGVLLGRAGGGDAIDATVVAAAAAGDRILTSDPHDLGRLVAASGRAVLIVPV